MGKDGEVGNRKKIWRIMGGRCRYGGGKKIAPWRARGGGVRGIGFER